MNPDPCEPLHPEPGSESFAAGGRAWPPACAFAPVASGSVERAVSRLDWACPDAGRARPARTIGGACGGPGIPGTVDGLERHGAVPKLADVPSCPDWEPVSRAAGGSPCDAAALPSLCEAGDRRRLGCPATRTAAPLRELAVLVGNAAPSVQHGFAAHPLAASWTRVPRNARELSNPQRPAEELAEPHPRAYRDGGSVAQALLGARAEVSGRHESGSAAFTDSAIVPGFSEGRGIVPSDRLYRSAVEAIQAAADDRGWRPAPDGRPYYPSPSRPVTLSVAADESFTADGAWELVGQLDDGTADVLDVLMARYFANRGTNPDGLVYVTTDEILTQLGRKPETHGGYAVADRQAVSRSVQALASLEVEGRDFVRYEKAGNGRSRKITVAPVGYLIEAPVREDLKRPDGTRGLAVGWHFRPGAWWPSLVGEAGTPTFAQMVQTVVALDAYQNRHAKRLGRYLTWQFRVRAFQRSYDQPWTVGSLLAGAGIPLPERNPGRFIGRIEAALGVLRSPGAFGPPVIAGWRYLDDDPLPPRRLLEAWLRRRVVVHPPSEVRAAYDAIGRRRPAGARGVAQAVAAAG